MFFPGPISNNRQDFGGGACPSFAGELLGTRWPSVSFGLGHIASDVAFLGILRFTAEPGAGRAPEVGVSGRSLLHRATRIPSGGGSCTMKKSWKKVSPFSACAWISPIFYFRLGRSFVIGAAPVALLTGFSAHCC